MKKIFYPILFAALIIIIILFYFLFIQTKNELKPPINQIQSNANSSINETQKQSSSDNRFGIWSPGFSQSKELYQLFLTTGARQQIYNLSWKKAMEEKNYLNRLESDITKATSDGVNIILILKTNTNWPKVKESIFSYQISEARAEAPPKDSQEWYDFVNSITQRFKGKIKYYALMDEVHYTFSGTVEEYLELLKTTSQAIHAADANSNMVPGFTPPGVFIACEMNDLYQESKIQKAIDLHNKFLNTEVPIRNENDLKNYLASERINKSVKLLNALYSDYAQYVDVVEFHSYNLYNITDRVLNYIKTKMTKNGINKPIIAEIGTLSAPGESVSEATRQEDLVRNFAVTLGNGVSSATWYSLTDSADRKSGLVEENPDKTFSPRKAYNTLKLLIFKIGGFESQEAINLGSDIFAYKFVKEYRSIYILWSEQEKTIKLDAPSNTVIITDVSDKTSESPAQQIHLTKSPIFVEEK